MILVLLHVKMEPSNVRKKIKEPPNVTKVLSNVMLEQHSVRMESSNVIENMGTTECDKRTVICDVGIVQCETGIIKCEEKK